jgi:hypothetical protein
MQRRSERKGKVQRKSEKIRTDDVGMLPPRQVTCRVQHEWPSDKIITGKPVPRGVTTELVDPDTDLWEMVDLCLRCGLKRRMWCPGRVPDGRWRGYKQPRDWVTLTVPFYRSDARRENFGRMADMLFPDGGEL